MAKILVVDDIAANRDLLSKILGYRGHETLNAADGVEALDQVREEQPDLVVCDILMPRMDGYEFVRALRADRKIARTPVLFYTAYYRDHEAKKLADACGVREVLTKPSDPEKILQVVEHALAEKGIKPTAPDERKPDFDTTHLRLMTDKLSVHTQELERQVRELEKAQVRLEAQYEVTATLAESVDAGKAASAVLRTVCGRFGFEVGELWEWDRHASRFRCMASRTAGTPPLNAFAARAREMEADPEGSLIQLALRSPEALWIRDVSHRPDFPRKAEAEAAGLRTAVVLPAQVDGETTAVLEFLSTKDGQLDSELLRTLTAIGTAVGQFLERVRQRRSIERLSRIRAVLSGINSAIVRIRDRPELLKEACRIAVSEGQFRLAWIGLRKRDPDRLDIVAWDGDAAGHLGAIRAGMSEAAGASVWKARLVWQAMHCKEPVISNDVAGSPNAQHKDSYATHRIGSLAMLPVLSSGEAVGVLALYAEEPGFFDEEELKLLRELAGDIGFGLTSIANVERVAYLAYYDALTDLPNRSLFGERAAEALKSAARRGEGLAVVFGNLQRFRLVNETFGREAGDGVLRELARRLRSGWPEGDCVARVGPDVFAAVLTGAADEADIARRLDGFIAGALKAPLQIGGHEISIAVSVGVAVHPSGGDDADVLIKNAEAALKKARDSRQRVVFYRPEMSARITEKLLLETKLRRAVEQEQFILHYQPKVDAATRRIVGLEALIRWPDPETGLVLPGMFIPLLEETGLILDVGGWAMREALAQSLEWTAEGVRPPRIAVNVSSIQLRQDDFVDTVTRAVRAHPGAEGGLDLEITESMIMTEIEASIAKLAAVRALGVNVSVDDFGTGYSSLGYLSKLPVNALKIDRSFVSKMATASDSMSIVSTVISLAHSLDLKVVAEGVETEEQFKFLRLLRCDEIQGYLTGRPQPADAILELLRKQDEKR